MYKLNSLWKAKRCSQEILMQADNQDTDHLAGPFGCVFTLFDSQPWTKRNMLANSRNRLHVGRITDSPGLSGRSRLRPSWTKERLSVRPGVGKCNTYQSFKESFSSCRTTRNHIPHPLFQLRQPQLFRDFGRCHCTGYILFVRKHQK